MSMLAIRDHALVLRRDRHLDNDVRLILFLRNTGKVSVVAKGVKKSVSKLKALCEPFVEAEVQVMLPEHGVFGRLISGTLVDSHLNIRTDIPAFGTAARCVEVIHEMIPTRVPTEEVYDILRAAFQALNQLNAPEVHWIHFVSRLLHHLGHGDISPTLEGHALPRRLAIINDHLENHLQKRLKSEVLNFS